jgi:hypothetical protein
MTHDEFEASAKKFCDEFHARLAATQDPNEIEALRKTFRRNMDEVCRLPAALAEGAMQRLTDTQDWSELEALRESLREHMAEIHRLRAALAEPEQEPVATVTSETGNPDITMSWWHEPALPIGTKLYTTPPRREWRGLTEEEAAACWSVSTVRTWQAVEAALKERNA